MSNSKKFAVHTVIYGVSTVITRSLYFVLTPIYVGLLSVGVYGVFTKMYSWSSIISAILSFGMETAFFRYINKYNGNKNEVYSNSVIAILFFCSLFGFLIFTFLHPIALWLSGNDNALYGDYIFYIKCLSFVLIIDAISIVPFALIRANESPLRYGLIKIANIVVVVVLNLFFLFGIPFIINHRFTGAFLFEGWYRNAWVGYIFLANASASAFTLVMLLPEIFQIRLKINFKLLKEMAIYSFPILIANVSFIINENIDKIMLDKLLPSSISEQEIGIYSANAKLALFLSLFVMAFRLGSEPFFFSNAKNKNAKETYAKIMNYFVIVVSIIFLAIVANIELLKYFIKGSDTVQQALYWSGLKAVPVLLFGYLSLGIYMNLSVWYKLSDQTKYGIYIASLGAVITIILNIIYIPLYGYMASAWISLIAYTTMMILTYIWGQRKYPIPYNLKKIISYISCSLLFVFLSFIVFDRNLIIGNVLLIIFLLGTFFIEKSELILIYRKR